MPGVCVCVCVCVCACVREYACIEICIDIDNLSFSVVVLGSFK